MALLERVEQYRNQLAGGAFALASLWVLIRIQGIHPAVMQDEYVYSMQARKIPLAEQDYPNYLHSLVYATTDLCGSSYYNCAKTYNWVFLVGFAGLIFLTARRFIAFWPAFAISIATLLSPLAVYASFFTPESMYFFFSLLALLTLWRSLESGQTKLIIASGVANGFAALVKPHALFLMVAAAIVVASADFPWRKRVVAALGYLFAAVGTKLLFGLLVAGPSGFSLFGPSYTSSLFSFLERVISGNASANAAGMTATVGAPSMPTMLAAIVSGQLIWLVVAVLVILGSAVGIALIGSFLKGGESVPGLTNLTRLSVSALVVMVLAIAAFGSLVTVSGDDHSARVLLRYIEFLAPLVSVVALAQLASSTRRSIWFTATFATVSVVAVIWLVTNRGSMTWLFIDSPWMKALTSSDLSLWLAVVISLASLIVLLISTRLAGPALAILVTVSLVVFGTLSLSQLADQAGNPGLSDDAGDIAKTMLESVPAEQILIVGPDRPNSLVTAFLIDKPGIEVVVVPPFRPLSAEDIPEGIEWIVALRSSAVEVEPSYSYLGNGWAIFNISPSSDHLFTKVMQRSMVESSIGLEPPSQMGQRLSDETAELSLAGLPVGQVTLELTFLVGPNGSGKDVTFEIGDVNQTAQLPQEGQIVTSKFQITSSGADSLKISVPDSGSNAVSLISLRVLD